MKQAFSHTVLRSILAAHQGQHSAHAAMIRRELVIKFGQDTTHLGGIIGQDNLIARFSQLYGRLDPGNAGTSHQDCACRLLFSHNTAPI